MGNVADVRELAKDPRHPQFFREFCRYEKAAGGPDSHMATVGAMCAGLPAEQVAWRAGVYIAVYNVPTAEYIWDMRDRTEVLAAPGEALEGWLAARWPHIGFRRERKAVRSPAKLARCLRSYAEWVEDLPDRPWMQPGDPVANYELAWQDAASIYGFGRYVNLKLLEFYTRYLAAPIELPDLRAEGGWSPREALALLYPNHAADLMGPDTPHNVALANRLAEVVRHNLWGSGLEVSRYEVQVLLCDYKQAYAGQRQYPGRSLDSELEYMEKLPSQQQADSQMWSARDRAFPRVALGERQGWRGVRKELGKVLRRHGYTWSDLRYDYGRTVDLAQPVPR